jgi:type VI secretion system secreted protein VgrG
MSDGRPYGFHFPVKRGAEMVLASVDGNPDRPIGLGFVPNVASPSVINDRNLSENIMRTWGGNELVMNDSRGKKSIKLSTPGERYLELHDGDELVRIKSADSELLFNDAEKQVEINAGNHVVCIVYKDGEGNISIKTASGNVIEMNDPKDIITIQNAGEEGGTKINKVVLNGNDKSITLDSMDNTVVLNGKDKRITVESEDSKVAIDGKGKKITLCNGDNVFTVNGSDGTIKMSAQSDVTIKSGRKIIFDAKDGVSNSGQTVKLTL